MNRLDRTRQKLGDVAAVLRGRRDVGARRELVAAWCKMALPAPAGGDKAAAAATDAEAMAPRMRQTLGHLLRGDSEKQIANKLGISQHTVHVYVKRLYRHYGANSRGELLARFVASGAAKN